MENRRSRKREIEVPIKVERHRQNEVTEKERVSRGKRGVTGGETKRRGKWRK